MSKPCLHPPVYEIHDLADVLSHQACTSILHGPPAHARQVQSGPFDPSSTGARGQVRGEAIRSRPQGAPAPGLMQPPWYARPRHVHTARPQGRISQARELDWAADAKTFAADLTELQGAQSSLAPCAQSTRQTGSCERSDAGSPRPAACPGIWVQARAHLGCDRHMHMNSRCACRAGQLS